MIGHWKGKVGLEVSEVGRKEEGEEEEVEGAEPHGGEKLQVAKALPAGE